MIPPGLSFLREVSSSIFVFQRINFMMPPGLSFLQDEQLYIFLSKKTSHSLSLTKISFQFHTIVALDNLLLMMKDPFQLSPFL